MSQKFVSVVVCTYNRAKYLDRCLQSLQNQSYPDYEIIVVNGPSTDETDHILSQYENIRIIQQKELNGVAFARNLGIVASSGGFVAFIDDDAEADENWLHHIITNYTDESIGGVGGIVYGFDKTHIHFYNGTINKAGIPTPVHNEKYDLKNDEFKILLGTNCSFRRDVLFEIGGFDPYFKYYHEESELCVRVVKAGYKVVCIKDAFVIHHIADGHNRKSYNLNWFEIIKNMIYFAMKNYGEDFSSYTLRPIYAILEWIGFIQHHFWYRRINIEQLLNFYLQVAKGAFTGYRDGLFVNIWQNKEKTSFLDIEPREIRLIKSSENLK